MQYLDSANQCILKNMDLRSKLLRNATPNGLQYHSQRSAEEMTAAVQTLLLLCAYVFSRYLTCDIVAERILLQKGGSTRLSGAYAQDAETPQSGAGRS